MENIYHDERISHHFGAGTYIREGLVNAGEKIEKHVHTYDHLSILGSGIASIEIDDENPEIISGPKVILIEKNKKHSITAITDIVWFCIHSENGINMVNDIDNVHIIEQKGKVK